MELYKRRGLICPVPGESWHSAVGVAAANVTTALVAGEIYKLTVSSACYVRQSTTASPQAASAGAGSLLINPGHHDLLFEGDHGNIISVIRVATDGVCTLQRVHFVSSTGGYPF